jgi:putative DNA primase/helicase
MNNTFTDIVRSRASGAWLSILDALAPELEQVILKPGKRHIDCPVHGGSKGFRLFRDANLSGGGICSTCGPKPDGFAILMWLRQWSFPETLAAVATRLALNKDGVHRPIVLNQRALAVCHKQDDQCLLATLRKLWRESKPITHPSAEPVKLYLRSRGLGDSIGNWTSLRFHPAMQYRNEDGKLMGYYPALLALVAHDGKPVTLHRTFLTSDGKKAPFEFPKKMMGVPSDRPASGAAIRLGIPGRVLSVTEGIENALAITEATAMVTWPLLSASMMPAFTAPSGVEKLIIWADLDRTNVKGQNPGLDAARLLADRSIANGLAVEIRMPEGPIPECAKGVDWLDVYNNKGPNAFSVRSFL